MLIKCLRTNDATTGKTFYVLAIFCTIVNNIWGIDESNYGITEIDLEFSVIFLTLLLFSQLIWFVV